MNKANLIQLTFFILALVLFTCIFIGTSYYLYEYLLQASMLDLIANEINMIKKSSRLS